MIRPAGFSDLDAIEPYALEFAKLVGIEGYHWPVAKQTLSQVIASPEGVVFLYLRDGEIRGGIAGVSSRGMFSLERYCQEIFWFVDPGYRGVGSMRLLYALESWAREQHCDRIIAAALTRSPQFSAVESIYRENGYEQIESHWIREVAA